MTAVRGWEAERRRGFMLGLVPALVVLAATTVVPAVYLVATSLTPFTPVNPGSGLDFSEPWRNYVAAMQDARFLRSVWIQVQLSAVTVILQLAIGLGLALLLDIPSRLLEAVRTAFLLPMVLPPIVVAIIWKIIYAPDISPMHRMLRLVGLPVRSLVANAHTALWAVAAADTWEWFPFTMLMMLAALQMVPKEPIEAAQIDGANRVQLFWFVRLPYIEQALLVTALFRLIDSIKAFPLIYILTDGGPGRATEVTNYYDFVQTFNFSYWGYGSAVATLMVAGVFVLSWIVGRFAGDDGIDR
ncbi:carbohydrate ABC transporter permease [Rhodopila sp.]|uniref:carbohydrate ABC transporter permease n=1 Tax=Rhodopila sp. TaxID=2480087 RepID=UPI003D132145